MNNLCKCGCKQKINFNKTYIRGHNLRGRKITPETLEKLRAAKLGKRYTEEAKEKIDWLI
jgi:hypothetical protein